MVSSSTMSETSDSPFEHLFVRYGSRYPWFVSCTVLLGTISTVLTATIVNVALPEIMHTFNLGQGAVQILSTGFLAAMTSTMLLNAWLIERFGLRTTYLLAMGIFFLASLLGGLASIPQVLIFARLLQGGAAGVLQPFSMQVLFQVFPPEKRGSAMGIMGVGVVLAPAFGPPLGGIMVDSFSWHYVFFLGLPLAAAAFVLAILFLPGLKNAAQPRPFDWFGFAFMIIFLVNLFYGLSNGQRYGWGSEQILFHLALALIFGGIFLIWERKQASPLLNLHLFRKIGFAGACLVAFIFGAGNFGTMYLVPLFVQTIQGYTPTQSGLLLMPAGLILVIIFPISGRLADRLQPYIPILIGLGLFSLSSLLMTHAKVQTPFWLFTGWLILGRIGLGTIIPSLNAGSLRALPLTQVSQGSGALNFIRQLGGAFGVNTISVLLDRRTDHHVRTLMKGQTSLDQGIHFQANIMGYHDCFLAVAIIFLMAFLPALLMKRQVIDHSK